MPAPWNGAAAESASVTTVGKHGKRTSNPEFYVANGPIVQNRDKFPRNPWQRDLDFPYPADTSAGRRPFGTLESVVGCTTTSPSPEFLGGRVSRQSLAGEGGTTIQTVRPATFATRPHAKEPAINHCPFDLSLPAPRSGDSRERSRERAMKAASG